MKLCKTIDKKKSNAIFRHVPISRKFGVEIPGRDPKKSRNLIAVLCYFCEWLDFWDGGALRVLRNVANVKMLPVSVFNFQCGRHDKLATGNIGIGTIITAELW